jgi:hypothetical protein
MKLFILIIFILSCFGISAKVLNHEIIEGRLQDFSYVELCETMKSKNTMLISPIGLAEIECFNQKIKVADFCLKKLSSNANFTRGFINITEKKIYCETAKAVTISLDCEGKTLCKNPKNACEKLQQVYAIKLEVNHSSNIAGKLSCYFTTNEELDLKSL